MLIMGLYKSKHLKKFRGGKRKRVDIVYTFHGKKVCQRVYRYIYDIGQNLNNNKNILEYLKEDGPVPRVHGKKGRKAHNAHRFMDIMIAVS